MLRRSLLVALLLLTSAVPVSAAPLPPVPVPSCSGYPEPRVYLETQSWWSDSNEPFPGAHLHSATCFPLHQIITGVVRFDIDEKIHANPGAANFRRMAAWSAGSVAKQVTQNISPAWNCGVFECVRTSVLNFDTAGMTSGRRQFRLTLNVPVTPVSNRQFNTTRWDACIRSCTGGSPPQIDNMGAAGWYTGSEYTNVSIRHADGLRLAFGPPLSGVVTLQLRGEDDSLDVAVDASAHGSNPGLVLFDGPGGNVWRTVTLDTTLLADGTHKLHIRTDDTISSPDPGISSGVFVIPFTVDNP